MRIIARSSDQKPRRLSVSAALLLAALVLFVSLYMLAPAQARPAPAAPDFHPEPAVTTAITHTTTLPDQPAAVEAGPSAGLETTPAWLAPFTRNSVDAAWGDMDSDGALDLVVVHGDQPDAIYLNQDGQVFATTVLFSEEAGWIDHAVALGDMDRDGDLDIVMGGGEASGDQLRIYRNDTVPGVGLRLTLAWLSLDPVPANSLALGDLDRDGDLDLVIASGNGVNQAYLNVSGGNVILMTPWWTNASAFNAASANVALGDVNRDGFLDLAVATDFEEQLYLNISGTLAATPMAWSPQNDQTWSVAWGDMNGDGWLDLATGNVGTSKVYLNQGGTLEDAPTWTVSTPGSASRVAWGDVDGDGDLDLAVGNQPSNNHVYVNQNGLLDTTPAWVDPATRETTGVTWGDADGDGDLDLLATVYAGLDVVYENKSGMLPRLATATYDLAFTPALITEIIVGQSAAWGDIDGDGDLDLAAGYAALRTGDPKDVAQSCHDSYGGAPNVVYRNVAGVLQPGPMWTSAHLSPTMSVAWGDVDGDGDLDLAVGNNLERNELYRNVGGMLQSTPYWQAESWDATTSLAWGDVDGDGDLDLAVGTCGGASQLYMNVGDLNGTLERAAWNPPNQEVYSVAWGDVDGDGDLDLVTSGPPSPYVYLNQDGQLPNIPSYNVDKISNGARSSVLGDYDGDGDLDLAVGIWSGQKRIYKNENGRLQSPPAWLAQDADLNLSLAWGDADGDGDLDLASGNVSLFSGGAQDRVYWNEGGQLSTVASWQSNSVSNTLAVAWGDVNGDGALDLAALHQNDPLEIFVSQRPPEPVRKNALAGLRINLVSDPVSTYNGRTSTALAPADFYAVPGIRQSGVIPITYTLTSSGTTIVRAVEARYSPDGGGNWYPAMPTPGTVTDNFTVTHSGTYLYAWDVLGSGFLGQSDNVVFQIRAYPSNLPATGSSGDSYQQPYLAGQTYPFRVRGTQVRVFSETTSLNNVAANAIVYRLPYSETLEAEPIADRTGQPFHTNEQGYLQGRGQIAISDTLFALLPLNASRPVSITYVSADVPQAIDQNDPNTVYSTLEVPNSGRILDLNVRQLSGTHTYLSDLTFLLQSPAGTSVVIMSPACGDENDFSLSLDDEALLSAWPCPPTDGGVYQPSNLLSAFDGEDPNGIWTLTVIDSYFQDGGSLDRWGLEITTDASGQQSYILYNTNATPTATGLTGHTVTSWGGQDIVVTAAKPLLLFNLSIALEWDARQDAATLNRLEFDLQRASELLFDWTNGQAALGRINLYQAGEHWNDANVRLFATNRLRPNASQGGVVLTPLSEVITTSLTSTQVITYEPGQIRMAVNWNRYGDPGGTIGDDWARALAHELGHYLFFQDDNYLGYDNAGNFVAVASCPGAMGDPYSGDKASGYDEFHPVANWAAACANTLANRETGRSDWQTVERFYPALNETLATTAGTWGPSSLPLAVTTIDFKPMADDTLPMPLLSPNYSLLRAEGGNYAARRASAYLFQDTTQDGQADRLVEMGSPVSGKVEARGARVGDRLCVFDPEAKRLGCDVLNGVKNSLALTSRADWSPSVLVTPVTSRTIQVTVRGVADTVSMQAQLFPRDAAASEVITLNKTDADTYDGTFVLPVEALEASVYVWINEPGARRETLTSYSIGGNPAPRKPGNDARSDPPRRFKRAPVLSGDGQAQILGIQGTFPQGEFYALQNVDNFPAPPSWTSVVGKAYRLVKSANAPSIAGSSFVVNYLEGEVPPGEETFLSIYFYPAGGTAWQRLPTSRDPDGDLVSAPAQPNDGLYLLLSSIDAPLTPGWNNVAYPVQGSRPVAEALASIAGQYSHVCGYLAADSANPWHCFGPAAPGWVNDLTTLKYGSYWINLTAAQAVTLSLKGPFGAALQQPDQSTGLQLPPAVYYGQLSTGAAGLTLNATINGQVCGQTTAQTVEGLLRYVIDVYASDVGGASLCGEAGRSVTFRLGEQTLAPMVTWSNANMWEQNLDRAEYKVYLPLVRR
jgi:subtilisin-like proprotein convertase family protein